jgi:hypothetical protein
MARVMQVSPSQDWANDIKPPAKGSSMYIHESQLAGASLDLLLLYEDLWEEFHEVA